MDRAAAGTVDHKVQDGFTGPRVTKVVFAVDLGLPINPLGLQDPPPYPAAIEAAAANM